MNVTLLHVVTPLVALKLKFPVMTTMIVPLTLVILMKVASMNLWFAMITMHVLPISAVLKLDAYILLLFVIITQLVKMQVVILLLVASTLMTQIAAIREASVTIMLAMTKSVVLSPLFPATTIMPVQLIPATTI